MVFHEQASIFDCEGCRLIGVIARPERPQQAGVVIVVGGPQYRAGSHRQFTLLARQLAERGIASIRFDYRGMGDSEGKMRNFEDIDADIKAAIDELMTQVPEIERVALWGLCDAASAALYYGHTDPRVKGLVLLNPWVHTEAGAARARLKNYYVARLLSRSFWDKLLSGNFRLGDSFEGLTRAARQAGSMDSPRDASPADPRHGSPGYIDRMLKCLKSFRSEIQIILSGNDLTAQEFTERLKQDGAWRKAVADRKVKTAVVQAANHTFASRAWRDQAAAISLEFVMGPQDV
ncbi:MAG: hydrolase 1, exosortase A system-associated [Thiobacillus sp.]|nr:hydrolase 1, exosortase A system-associated [Thiobacillus sp.]